MKYPNNSIIVTIRASLVFAMFLSTSLVFPLKGESQELRRVENTAFQRGEKMVYRVYYNSMFTGNVSAGEATLEVLDSDITIGGRKAMHVVSLGRTRGLFNMFFKVVNRYETYIDERAIAPLAFVRRIQEGGYEKNQDVTFNHFTNIATSNTATVKVVPYVQDIISAFYYARTYDYTNSKPGDEFNVDFFLDDTVHVTRIVFDGREQVKTRLGTFNTLRFKPMVLAGNVFSQPYPMTLWISDDKNKIPIMLESGIIVGRVRMELVEHKGLRNPMTSKIK